MALKSSTRKPPQRPPSSGSLSLIEDLNGGIRLEVELDEIEGTSMDVINRIRAGIAGMNYIFETDGITIENIGKAYIIGMEEGFKRGRRENKDDKKKTGNYKTTNIGFHKIKEETETESNDVEET